jgi:hypothetical protein
MAVPPVEVNIAGLPSEVNAGGKKIPRRLAIDFQTIYLR